MTTLLDSNQALQHAFDDDAQALKVVGTVGASKAVEVTATTPLDVTIVSGASTEQVVLKYNIPYTNLTTSYYEVAASLSSDIIRINNYDTTGETIEVAVGAAASEVVKYILGPGSDQAMPIIIASGSRLAVRTVGSNATAGSLILNLISAI